MTLITRRHIGHAKGMEAQCSIGNTANECRIRNRALQSQSPAAGGTPSMASWTLYVTLVHLTRARRVEAVDGVCRMR